MYIEKWSKSGGGGGGAEAVSGWVASLFLIQDYKAGRQAGRDEIKNISRLLVYSLASTL